MDAIEAAKLVGAEKFPDGWQFLPIHRTGKLAGFFCFKENEIHAHRLEEFSGLWLTRQDIESISAPLIKKYGCVVTTVRDENEEGHRFVSRLGFEKTHQSGGLTHYRAKRIRHARY